MTDILHIQRVVFKCIRFHFKLGNGPGDRHRMEMPILIPNFRGAIFDWDGVVIDSAVHHRASWEKLAAIEKLPLPPGHFERGFGMKNIRIIPDILQWTTREDEIHRLSEKKESLYRDDLREHGIAPLPGILPWLQTLKKASIPCVIGSSTHRENIELALELTHLRPFFLDIVSAGDVKQGKPHPEVFLKAAEKIKVPASQCVVFEDALVGIEAAHAGGMRVVAVTTTRPAPELTAADWVVDRLDELQPME